jgi:hypothetical protein
MGFNSAFKGLITIWNNKQLEFVFFGHFLKVTQRNSEAQLVSVTDESILSNKF